MLILNAIVYFFPPKEINKYYGYRSKQSMKNQRNWDFAQKRGQVNISVCCFLFLFLNVGKAFLLDNEKYELFNMFLSIGIALLSLLIGVFITEWQIKNIDKHK